MICVCGHDESEHRRGNTACLAISRTPRLTTLCSCNQFAAVHQQEGESSGFPGSSPGPPPAPRSDEWEAAEIALREELDDDQAVTVLQILQARGWRAPDEVQVPADQIERDRLASFAGLTNDERKALDQWCYDQQRQRDQGIVSSDEVGRQ